MKNKLLRFFSLFAAVLFMLATLSCANADKQGSDGDTAAKAFSDMTLEEILSEIYAKDGYGNMLTELINAPVPSDPYDFSNHLIITEITDQNVAGYLGTTDVEFEYAIASEAAINPTTYLLCLIKLREGENAKDAAELIKKSADPNRWVCTGVSPSHVYTDYSGDIVILVMSDTDGEALIGAFRDIANR